MSVARFIADQRTKYRVPHTITCVLLGVSVSWFYKWITRAESTDGLHTDTDRRRARLDTAVAAAFTAAKGLHGSPRLIADLRDLGWEVSEKSVADSMRRQGLVARRIKRRNGLTKQDKTAPKFPDLVKRDFTAAAPNRKWVGDMTEIPTECGQKLYLATVLDLYSRRLLGAAMGLHPGIGNPPRFRGEPQTLFNCADRLGSRRRPARLRQSGSGGVDGYHTIGDARHSGATGR